MEQAYTVNYDQTLTELKGAAIELLSGATGIGHLYQTQDRKKLFNKYLRAVAEQALKLNNDTEGKLRQQLTCSHCHRFMARVGGVVYMVNNKAVSVFWNPDVVTDPVMKAVVAELKAWVESSRVHNLFDVNGAYAEYTEETHNTQDRRHFYIPQEHLVARSPLNGSKLHAPDKKTFYSRMMALLDFVGGSAKDESKSPITLPTLLTVDQWFQSKTLNPTDGTVKTIASLKALLTSLATVRNNPAFQDKKQFDKETELTNLIWRYALTDSTLLTAKNSTLGQIIYRLQLLNDGKRGDDSVEKIQTFWRIETAPDKRMRSTREASVNQVEKAMLTLEQGDWLRSLEQIEASEDTIPALWVSASKYSEEVEEDAQDEEESSFAKFAQGVKKDKKVAGVLAAAGMTDAGYFFNEILPNVSSMVMVINDRAMWKPTFINRMKHLDAKPIFRHDTEESPGKFTMYGFQELIAMADMVRCYEGPNKAEHQKGQYFIDIASVTTPGTTGVTFENGEPIMFLLNGLRSPSPARPALFADAIKGELYDLRRTIEDYSRVTQLKPCEGQQAIGFPFGPRHPQHSYNANNWIEVRVKFTKDYADLMGSQFGEYRLDLNGFVTPLDLTKFPTVLRPLELPVAFTATAPEPVAEEAAPAESSMVNANQ